MSHLERDPDVKVAKARPITGLILGLIAGLALAVILQQAGVWPLDKLTVYLLPGLVALIFILIARAGRDSSPVALTVALILLVAPIAYGLTGIGEIDESGVLNGGCTVEAATDVDTTVVTETSRTDPFVVEPEGPLAWLATSPGPITDHVWEIYVVIGGFEWTIADGGDANADMEVGAEGEVSSVEGFVEDLTGQTGQQIRGVYEAGGFIEGTGGACDGFGFVKIDGGWFPTIISWVALVIFVLAVVLFFLVALTGRERPVETESDVVIVEDPPQNLEAVGGGMGAASVAAASDEIARSDDTLVAPPPGETEITPPPPVADVEETDEDDRS
jgi:hypothetical protein